MKKYIACALSLMMFTSSPSFSADAPKLTVEQAQEIALKKVAGKVQKHELENEGANAIYTFEIKTPENKTIEVEVNGNTGEVLEVENGDDKDDEKREGKDDDKDEDKDDDKDDDKDKD